MSREFVQAVLDILHEEGRPLTEDELDPGLRDRGLAAWFVRPLVEAGLIERTPHTGEPRYRPLTPSVPEGFPRPEPTEEQEALPPAPPQPAPGPDGAGDLVDRARRARRHAIYEGRLLPKRTLA